MKNRIVPAVLSLCFAALTVACVWGECYIWMNRRWLFKEPVLAPNNHEYYVRLKDNIGHEIAIVLLCMYCLVCVERCCHFCYETFKKRKPTPATSANLFDGGSDFHS